MARIGTRILSATPPGSSSNEGVVPKTGTNMGVTCR